MLVCLRTLSSHCSNFKLAPHEVGYPGGVFAPFIPGNLEELKVKEIKNGEWAAGCRWGLLKLVKTSFGFAVSSMCTSAAAFVRVLHLPFQHLSIQH
jgi:hypothetical protein